MFENFANHFALLCVTIVMTLTFSGCETTGNATAADGNAPPTVPAEDAFFEQSPNQAIGTVHWVDPVHRLAIIRLSSNRIPVADRLIARNEYLDPVAVLRPGKLQRGRFFGVYWETGPLQVGQEVIIPDPENALSLIDSIRNQYGDGSLQ